MKRKEIKELHHKSTVELTKELQLKQKELTKLQLETKVKREKNTRRKRFLRDDIARIFTLLQLHNLRVKEQKT